MGATPLHRLLILVLAVAVFGIASGSARAATVYTVYSPFTPGGKLRPGITKHPRHVRTVCRASISDSTRADAYRCVSGKRTYDPCFQFPTQPSRAACVLTPWSTGATILRAHLRRHRATNSHPFWALAIASGAPHCRFTLHWRKTFLFGERLNYVCNSPGIRGFLYGEPNMSQPDWTIHALQQDPKGGGENTSTVTEAFG